MQNVFKKSNLVRDKGVLLCVENYKTDIDIL